MEEANAPSATELLLNVCTKLKSKAKRRTSASSATLKSRIRNNLHSHKKIPVNLAGIFFYLYALPMHYYLVGIKGTGMAHLASYLAFAPGVVVEGADVEEDFFTSPLLKGFCIYSLTDPLPDGVGEVIYSTAYSSSHPRAIVEAREKGIPVLSYPEALSALSCKMPTFAVTGTHGKTTTTSVAAYLLSSINACAGAIYGSFLQGVAGAYHDGDGALVLEGCEYQDHFLSYHLSGVLVTSVQFDHPDYFKDLESVEHSFLSLISRLPSDGVVFYESDIRKSVIQEWQNHRPDLKYFSYGFSSDDFHLVHSSFGYGITQLPGAGVIDLAADKAIWSDYLGGALIASLVLLSLEGAEVNEDSLNGKLVDLFPRIATYPGVSARTEIVCIAHGITFIDDYAHHPDEIKVAISNVRLRYPGHRIAVLFMPHTASRTRALFKEFVSVLSSSDILVIEQTYASLRGDDDKGVAQELEKAIEKRMERHFLSASALPMYAPSDEEAIGMAASFLQEGDVCITMGAGDNRRLIRDIVQRIEE